MANRSIQSPSDDPTAKAAAAVANVETVVAPDQADDDQSAEVGGVVDAADEAPERPADAKSAFAAVLARKQQAAQNRSAHLDGHGAVGGATANHKATRTFRRKSG